MCEKADGEKVGFALSVADDMLTEQRGRITGYSGAHSNACVQATLHARSGNVSPFEKQNTARGLVAGQFHCILTRYYK